MWHSARAFACLLQRGEGPIARVVRRIVREERAFRDAARETKDADVGAARLLIGIGGARFGERGEVRRRERREREQAFGMVAREMPPDDRAPVVAHEVKALRAELVGEAQNVARQRADAVGGHIVRPRARRISPLVDGDRAIPGRAEAAQQRGPRIGELRPAVQ